MASGLILRKLRSKFIRLCQLPAQPQYSNIYISRTTKDFWNFFLLKFWESCASFGVKKNQFAKNLPSGPFSRELAQSVLCIWRSRVFASKLALEDEMTAQSKEVIASVSENEQQRGRGFKSQMFLGELPRREEFQNDRWSGQVSSRGRAYTGKVRTIAKRKTHHKQYQYFFIFQTIYFIHTSKQLHCSNLFKNAWITRMDLMHHWQPCFWTVSANLIVLSTVVAKEAVMISSFHVQSDSEYRLFEIDFSSWVVENVSRWQGKARRSLLAHGC